MQTYSCSAIIARNKACLAKTFSVDAEYLQFSNHDDTVYEPMDLGPELSRPHRSLKLWLTIQAMGTDEISTMISKAWHMTKVINEELQQLDNWEITSKPSSGTITFRYAPAGLSEEELDKLNWAISDKIIAEDKAYIVPTELKGKTVLRMCTINVSQTDDDIRQTLADLQECAQTVHI